MPKAFLLLLFALVLYAESAAQLKTIEIKKNFWTWTGTQYFMGEQKIRVSEIQLHLDKHHPEAGKTFRSGRAPMTWGWVALGASFGITLYGVFAYDPPERQNYSALFWTAEIGLWGASIYLINKSHKKRKKALDTYNGFVLQQEKR